MTYRPLRLSASYGDCPDVTDWDLLYDDVYQCRCCGVRQRLSQLTVEGS